MGLYSVPSNHSFYFDFIMMIRWTSSLYFNRKKKRRNVSPVWEYSGTILENNNLGGICWGSLIHILPFTVPLAPPELTNGKIKFFFLFHHHCIGFYLDLRKLAQILSFKRYHELQVKIFLQRRIITLKYLEGTKKNRQVKKKN